MLGFIDQRHWSRYLNGHTTGSGGNLSVIAAIIGSTLDFVIYPPTNPNSDANPHLGRALWNYNKSIEPIEHFSGKSFSVNDGWNSFHWPPRSR